MNLLFPQGIPATPMGSVTGDMAQSELDVLRKALEAGYGTDVASLTGGGALRVQSLDATLQAILAEQAHFKLFNALQKADAGATVDEWTEATDQGGFPGGTTNTETGDIGVGTGTYARRTGLVKYLMTQCQVSFVTTLQNAIVEAEATENQMGTLRLLRDVEHLLFEGDSTVVPTEFDGIGTQIVGLGSADHVIDVGGAALNSIDKISQGAATIAGPGNWGMPTHLYMSQLVQSDMDIGLDPAFRVPLNDVPGGGISLGAPVRGFRTSWGDIAAVADVFVRDEAQKKPFELLYPAVATANAGMVCAAVPTGVAASDASSAFGASHAGNYYYAVAGVSKAGQSAVSKSAAITVAAGDKVTLTITDSAGATETGYVIYRSRKNGTNATSDFRECARVAYGGATTTWVDYNRDIPGTSKAYLLNQSPAHHAITWRKLLPLTRFALYPTTAAVVPWALLLFGYLRISKRQQHIVFKNIVPSGASWKPFA